MAEELKFESALQQLEQIVAQLESGQLSLEDSMTAFEKGMKLSKFCGDKLSSAEKKIETLIKNSDGTTAWVDQTAAASPAPQP